MALDISHESSAFGANAIRWPFDGFHLSIKC